MRLTKNDYIAKNIYIVITLFLTVMASWGKTSCAETHTRHTQTISGKVIHISDGDTYDILTEGNITHRVRMLGIDAPEKGQDFHRKATDYLKSLLYNQTVTIQFESTDRYGRLLAFTYLSDGREASHEMIRAGYAWHYLQYNQDDDLAQLEQEAREKKIGLWASPNPIEPWVERANRREEYKKESLHNRDSLQKP